MGLARVVKPQFPCWLSGSFLACYLQGAELGFVAVSLSLAVFSAWGNPWRNLSRREGRLVGMLCVLEACAELALPPALLQDEVLLL